MRRVWVTSPSYEVAIERLVAARLRSGLSQRQLAESLGKSRSFISKIESRERRLDMVELVAIARALQMRPGALLDEIAEGLTAPLIF